jgi:hypothetical protein
MDTAIAGARDEVTARRSQSTGGWVTASKYAFENQCVLGDDDSSGEAAILSFSQVDAKACSNV